MIVASRAYVEANGFPETPEDLAAHPFVFYRSEHADSDVKLIREGRECRFTMAGSFCANGMSVIRKLVAEGKGLHLGPAWAFRDGLRDGSIVSVLPDYTLEAFPLHAVYVSRSFVPAKVRAFVESMAQAVRADPSLTD
tara:strand:- start:234 stop:647 length:414 start_codon:yes stop_codon:yes gene_type:complete